MRNHTNNSWEPPEDFKPTRILEIELSEPIPSITSTDESGEKIYQRALLLVRLHKQPLGLVNLDFNRHEIPSTQLSILLWSELGEHINLHLQEDGLPLKKYLTRDGLGSDRQPECIVKRQAMLSDAPLISIVVATRDRVPSLKIALESILALEYPHFEVVLVDNAPLTSETHTYFTQNQYQFARRNISLRYVREDIPGLAVAHNRGLQFTRGSIVAFTDDDVVVDKYWLTEILYGFRSASNVGCVTGLVIPSELQTPAQVLFEEFGGFTKGFTRQIYDLENNHPGSPLFPYAAGRFGTGANMAFQTELLQKAGGFDPALGTGTPAMGADDMAAFFQAIVQGTQLVYQSSALVFHQHRRTYEGLRKQMFGYGAGLTAFLTKCMIDYPGLILDMTSKIPAGIKYVFDPNSTKNKQKTDRYPLELERIERKGMLYGPIAYLVSRWRYRKVRRGFVKATWNKEPALSQSNPVSSWRADYQKSKRTKEL